MTTKRIPLYRENRKTIDDRIILTSTWSDPPLPLMLRQPDGSPQIIGTVTNLRRDRKTGWVTGLVTTPMPSLRGLAAEADFDNMEVDDTPSVDGLYVVTSARLRAITLGTSPTWPGMVI